MKALTWSFFTRRLLPSGLRLFAAFTQFFATLIIARTLGDVEASPFFFWSSVMMSVAVFSTFGLDRLLLQKTPTLEGDTASISQLVAQSRWLVMLVSLICGLLLVFYAAYTKGAGDNNSYWLILLPLGVVGIALCRLNAEALKGMGHPNIAIVHRQLIAGIGFLVLLALCLSVLSAELALLIYVSCFLLAGTLVHRFVGFKKLGFGYQIPDRTSAIAHLKAGFPICLGSFFYSLSLIVPLAILERSAPPESVSYLTTTYRIFVLVNLLAVAAYAIDLPALARSGYENNFGATRKIYLKMIAVTCAIFIVPVVLVGYFSELVMMLFGDDFVPAADVLRVFMLGVLISLILGPTEDLLLMQNQTTAIAVSSVLRLATVVVVGSYLIPNYHAIGMALTITLGVVAQKLFSLFVWWRKASTGG